MAHLLLIDDDENTVATFDRILALAGHRVITATSAREGLQVLEQTTIQLVLCDLKLPDMSGMDILKLVRRRYPSTAFVIVTGYGDTKTAVNAMRLGATNFVEKPVFEDDLLCTVGDALGEGSADSFSADDYADSNQRAHAAARWARVLMSVVDAPHDPRTIVAWSRLAFVSAGALRIWCRMAGIPPRRSLVFARLLRAVCLGAGGQHKPENLLDVVDRRTLVGLFRLAGLNPNGEFPHDVEVFLERQILVRDPDALLEVRRALARQARHVPVSATRDRRSQRW
jgi:ActR/RegA family two-component response regulator